MRSFLLLIRYKVSFLLSLSSFTGFVLYSHQITAELWYMFAGVYLLASSATVINQIQESKFDALMDRTHLRPIPSGTTTVKIASMYAFILLVFGAVMLFIFGGVIPLILGLLNIFWYNLIYTKLKRISAFAVVPGGLTGMIPPMIGYTAAGGHIFDYSILLFALFVFLWLVPHFWLLMNRYRMDYKNAGFPVISDTFYPKTFRIVTLSWMLASIFSIIPMMFYGIINSVIFVSFFLIAFIIYFIINYFKSDSYIYSKSTLVLYNVFMLLLNVILIFDNLYK